VFLSDVQEHFIVSLADPWLGCHAMQGISQAAAEMECLDLVSSKDGAEGLIE